jgi:molybdate transport system permease protein
MTLGAKPIKSFIDTTFKMAFPGVFSGFVLTWLRCVGEFGATLMVGGGISGKTENIPVHVYLNIISGDYEKGLGAGMIAIFLALFCIVLVNLLVTRRIRQTTYS